MSQNELKILCIDDDEDHLKIFSDLILEAKFIPLVALNASEAKLQFQNHKKDLILVICDYKMPDVNGLELRALMLPDALEVPFIIVSGYVTTSMALEAIDLKIDGFYSKPLDSTMLPSLIEKHSRARIESILETRALESVFIDEATEIVEDMDSALLALDQERNDADQLNLVFRYAHTIKGSSGVLSSNLITRYVHRYEDIISGLKKGHIEFTDSVYETLLLGLDRIKELISAQAAGKIEEYKLEELLEEIELKSKAESAAETKQDVPQKKPGKVGKSQKVKDSIPIPIETLERLSTSAGQITVLRNMVNKLIKSIEHQYPSNKEVVSLGELFDEMYKINSAIQSQITDLRKVPLSSIFKTIPRIVRDLGKELGKSIALKTEGEKIRVDNALANVLSNSLIHLIRNSADHGIESPEQRIASQKAQQGTIVISCKELNEDIVIKISDDGKGIDPQKIRSKALEKKLYTDMQLEEMIDSQVLRIIFDAGFSTASQVSDISGRGVGMDMVKASVETIGGKILVDSAIGLGSTFTLTLPIPKSVLIITSLLIESCGFVFAIPQDAIHRVLSIDSALFQDSVQMASLGKTLRQDDEIYPLISLSEILGLKNQSTSQTMLRDQARISIIILNSENLKYAIMVDAIHDCEEIVVKPIHQAFNRNSAFIGATFMADGTVSLILDVVGVARLAGLSNEKISQNATISKNSELQLNVQAADSAEDVLLFRLMNRSIFGVRLAQVFRLEEVDPKSIQRNGSKRMVIYRDKVMPILHLDKLLDLKSARRKPSHLNRSSQMIATIVAKCNEHYIGFEVDSVVDIARIHEGVQTDICDRKGIVGNTFISDQNVTIVDFEVILDQKISI